MDFEAIDYARLDYKRRAHHVRFVARVEREGLPCQECRGRGGWWEPVLDDGTGPWCDCGWCQGTGKVTRWLRGVWLRERRLAK